MLSQELTINFLLYIHLYNPALSPLPSRTAVFSIESVRSSFADMRRPILSSPAAQEEYSPILNVPLCLGASVISRKVCAVGYKS